jgi:hypothetical protein
MDYQAQASKDTRLIQEFLLDNAIGPIRETHIWSERPSVNLAFGSQRPEGNQSISSNRAGYLPARIEARVREKTAHTA